MRQFRTIVRKEWADMVRNKLVLYVVILVPLLMAAIPIAMLFVMSRVPISAQDMEEIEPMLTNPIFAGMTPVEAMQSVMASNMMVLFLMMPLMVPVTIASYSIVGEKMTRSLEPLLATPITTTRLLLAKGFAAAVPGIVMTWFCYVLFLIAARFLAASARVFAVFVDPMWLVAMFILAPLTTVMAVMVGVIVSSRVNDPRAAEQLGALVLIPLMALFIGAMAGFIMLNSVTFWIASALVAVADIGLVYLGTALFQRETILTRWK
ncbi:MAG: ABC transporter permease subunit [Anaerolineae bacterium]|nr:ABC transporter permease subunit [Anaerolineae bacterium]